MALARGTRLGPYGIIAPLGAGGMGEVYRARDHKLDREVAIKILPEILAADPDRIARFEREAKTLAALNHPHIATIHGFEEVRTEGAPSTRFLVMELVEGETLAERLVRGALPTAEALPIALQVADALQAAHEKGIVHRDLKPANIKITPTGVVKVLDFGLAKGGSELARDSDARDLTHSPTMTAAGTLRGTLLGTAPYMSPEQARGHVVDKRTDIWAFGCVLYEALAGTRAFPGDTITDTLAAIVQREPDWGALPDTLPAGVRRLLGRCLQKDRKRRLQDIGDAQLDIEDALAVSPVASSSTTDGTSRAPALPTGHRRTLMRSLLPLAIAASAVLAFSIGYLMRPPAAASGAFRFSILPPEGTSFLDVSRVGPPALSPDGRLVAFVADSPSGRALWVRSIDKFDARPLPGTDSAANPFWSPDGRRLAFNDAARGTLKSVEVTGGQPSVVAAGVNTTGTWNAEDIILYNRTDNFLSTVPASGGTPTPATERNVALQDENHLSPFFLPDGRHYLLQVRGGTELEYQLWTGELGSNERRLLVRRATNGQYAPPRGGRPGYILYGRDRNLIAQPFDASSLTLTGEPITIAERLSVSVTGATGEFSVSPGGVLAYRTEEPGGQELEWLDRSGKQVGVVGDRAGNPRNNVVLSPDNKFVAFTRQGEDAQDVWVHEFARNVTSRFTFAGGRSPVWSPDGSFLAFVRGDTIYRKRVAGESAEVALWKGEGLLALNDWSGDGRYILFTRWDTKAGRGLWLLPDASIDAGSRDPVLFESPALHGQFGPRIGAPQWIAFDAEERPGFRQAYVRTMPGVAPGKWQISSDSGNGVRARKDGREIYFLAGRSFVVVDVEPAPFRAGAPRPLFAVPPSLRTAAGQYLTGYDITADGSRFLVTLPTSGTSSPAINIVLNWSEELKQHVPTR